MTGITGFILRRAGWEAAAVFQNDGDTGRIIEYFVEKVIQF